MVGETDPSGSQRGYRDSPGDEPPAIIVPAEISKRVSIGAVTRERKFYRNLSRYLYLPRATERKRMSNGDHEEWIEYPYARIRFELDTDHGEPTRFVVQLEYEVAGDWRVVTRFDHDRHGEQAHDITEEGLHMDVYRDGEKHRVESGFPPVSLSHAPRYCKTYLETHADQFLRRFEQWHDLKRR